MLPLGACFGPTWRSVHFHSDQPDFLRLPPPWLGTPGARRALAPGTEYEVAPGAPPPGDPAPLEQQARRQETTGQFRQAADTWERCWDVWEGPLHAGSPDGAVPAGLKGLLDRTRALRAWRGPEDTPGLRAYLTARDAVNSGDPGRARRAIDRIPGDRYRARAEYLSAALEFRRTDPAAARRAFETLVRRRPDNALAAYMLGRILLTPYLTEDARSAAIPDRVRVADLRRAIAAFDAALRAAPTGRLALEAHGLAGACLYRLNDFSGAQLRYCRRLGALRPGQEHLPTWTSVRWCLRRMTQAEHEWFRQQALAEPATACAYLDLRLHYGRVSERTNLQLGVFALRLLARHPDAAVSGRVLARLAEVDRRAGHPERAVELARWALKRLPPGADQDQARWNLALALRDQGRRAEARAALTRIADAGHLPRLRRGAHEAAAVLSEELRDYPTALYHYFALEYQFDYAYVADCLAEPADLARFLRRYPGHPRANLVRYSLGFRQMRVGDYAAAIATFRVLGDWLRIAEAKFSADTSRHGPRLPPLEVALRLRDLEAAEHRVSTPAAKARAAYAAAALLFRQRHLAFYNAALWTGQRVYALDLGGAHNVSRSSVSPDAREKARLRRYQEEHAAAYQALRRFARVAEQYPSTPEAPRALYSAALCCTLLPSVERWWGDPNHFRATQEAMRFYRRLQRDYPRHPLAAAARKFGGPA